LPVKFKTSLQNFSNQIELNNLFNSPAFIVSQYNFLALIPFEVIAGSVK